MADLLHESFKEEVNKAFLPYDHAAWEAAASTEEIHVPLRITLGQVELRANQADLALVGTAYARRGFREISQPPTSPKEIGAQIRVAEARLILSPKQDPPPRPQLRRTVLAVGRNLEHCCEHGFQGPPSITRRTSNERTEMLVAHISGRGLFAGLIEASLKPDTWPANPHIVFYDSDELWRDITFTVHGGMSIVSLHPQEIEATGPQMALGTGQMTVQMVKRVVRTQ